MSSPSVAVILPVYRRPLLVLEALDGVAAQTRPPDRLVVVDDGSDDETPEVVARWLASCRLPSVELVRRPNGGIAVARNHGFRCASDADFYAYLDSDDVWHPRYLERVVDALVLDPGAVAGAGDRRYINYTRGTDRHQSMKRYETRTTERLLRHGPTGTSNTIFRGDAFRAERGFDESLEAAEDTELMLRLSLRGRWLHVPELLTTYRYEIGGSISATQSLSTYLAPLFDRFVVHGGGRDAMEHKVWSRLLSRRWCRAGDVWRARGERGQSLAAYRRAVELWSWNPRARYRIWRKG